MAIFEYILMGFLVVCAIFWNPRILPSRKLRWGPG